MRRAVALLQVWFGSSTSPNSAKKSLTIKRRKILYNAPLRHPDLRQGLSRCRDRHRRAWPIICAPFWAITSSLCVAISLFLALPHSLPYNRTDFGQYKSTQIVWRGLFWAQKKCPKNKKLTFLGFFLFFLCLRIFSLLWFGDRIQIKGMAANLKMSKSLWHTRYTTIYILCVLFWDALIQIPPICLTYGITVCQEQKITKWVSCLLSMKTRCSHYNFSLIQKERIDRNKSHWKTSSALSFLKS